jgi:hypothetical protein
VKVRKNMLEKGRDEELRVSPNSTDSYKKKATIVIVALSQWACSLIFMLHRFLKGGCKNVLVRK